MSSTIELPLRTSIRDDNGLIMVFQKPVNQRDYEKCIAASFMIHPSNEIPSSFEKALTKFFYFGGSMDVLITPTVIQAEESLKNIPLSIRKCYFEEEMRLEKFKIYTLKNCLDECISDKAYSECGCVHFNNLRNSSMQICNQEKSYCAVKVKNNALNKELCHWCLPTCNQISYETENIILRFDKNYDANL